MKSKFFFVVAFTFKFSGLSVAQETYRYEEQTKASEFAREFFGPAGQQKRVPGLDMGRYKAGVSSKIDCGSLDLEGSLKAELENLQAQVRSLLGTSAIDLAKKGAMMAVCYSSPAVCAQLRHDFLALQSTINLRAQACRAMDDFIDSSADKGAKQLRSEAQAECTKEKLAQGMSLASAMRQCQGQSGLPLRDFQAGLEKRFITGRQRVLESIVKFAKSGDGVTYDFLAGVLGEIEVQEDGYWQPMFAKGMLRAHEVAGSFLALGEAKVCGDRNDLFREGSSDAMEMGIAQMAKEKLTPEDLSHLEDLEREDRRLACGALGRALGQLAAQRTMARSEAILSSGLLNTAIPDSLRAEYRVRGTATFEALRKALASEEIPSLEEVKRAVSLLAKSTREKNRILAQDLSRGRLENYRQDSDLHSDCSDTLSCGGQP